MENMDILNNVITVKEAMELYGVDATTVRRWCAGQGKTPPRLPEGTYRKSGATWLMLKKYTDALNGK